MKLFDCPPRDTKMTPNILDPVTKKSDAIEEVEKSVRSRITTSEKTGEVHQSHSPSDSPRDKTPFKPQIRWPDLIAQVFIHGGSLYGLFYLITLKAKLYTYIWCKSRS